MSIPDLLIPKGELSAASGELLLLQRANTAGQEGFCMDVRVRYDATERDVPRLNKLFVGMSDLYGQGRRWPGDQVVKPGHTVKLAIYDVEQQLIIQGSAEVRSARLICRDLTRAFQFTARVKVAPGFVADVDKVEKLVRCEVRGAAQPEKKRAKSDPGQLTLFGRKVDHEDPPAVAQLVMPEEDQLVELRVGGKETAWAQVVAIEGEGRDAVVVLKDLDNARKRSRMPVLRVARAVHIRAPEDEKLAGLANRFKRAWKKAGKAAGNDAPCSWTYPMRAWAESGQKVEGVPLLDEDVFDRALELRQREIQAIERQLELRGHDLPPAAEG